MPLLQPSPSAAALTRCVLCLSLDSLGWKLFYVTGCLFVAVQNLEDWEVRPLGPGSLQWRPGLMPHAKVSVQWFPGARARPLGVACPSPLLAKESSEAAFLLEALRDGFYFLPRVAAAESEVRDERALPGAPSVTAPSLFPFL